MLKKIKLILLIPGLLVISSCIYIPTSDHGGESMISDEAMKFFIPGKTTRADVLLRFGKPIQSFEEDRYFLYHWEATVGYIFFGYGYSGAMGANPNLHYLCIEFTPDNKLRRYKHFEQGALGALGKHPEKQILEWMKNGNTHKEMNQ